MTEIGFYHLTRSKLIEALPQLLARTLATGHRALVLAPAAKLDSLSAELWAQPTWLPHGLAADGDPDLQPIWVGPTPEPLNGARFLFMVEGADTDRLAEFDRVFDIFDGNSPEAVAAARGRWKAAGMAGHQLTYWQQTDRAWQKKSEPRPTV